MDNQNEGKLQFSVRRIFTPNQVIKEAQGIVVEVRNLAEQTKVLEYIKSHPGNTCVTLKAYDQFFPLRWMVDGSDETKRYLTTINEQN